MTNFDAPSQIIHMPEDLFSSFCRPKKHSNPIFCCPVYFPPARLPELVSALPETTVYSHFVFCHLTSLSRDTTKLPKPLSSIRDYWDALYQITEWEKQPDTEGEILTKKSDRFWLYKSTRGRQDLVEVSGVMESGTLDKLWRVSHAELGHCCNISGHAMHVGVINRWVPAVVIPKESNDAVAVDEDKRIGKKVAPEQVRERYGSESGSH